MPKETKFLPLKSDSITWSHSDIISNVLNIPNIRLDIRLPRFASSENFLPKIPLMKSRQRWISLGVLVYSAWCQHATGTTCHKGRMRLDTPVDR